MGIRIDGTSDLINAADGSLTVEGLSINVSGVVTASDGFKSSGDITVGVSTFFVDKSATNVGVGTNVPYNNAGTNVHLHSANTTSEIRFTNSTTGGGNNGGTIQQGGNTLYVSNSESGNIAFENAGAERVRITSDGDVIMNRSGNDLASAHSANGLYVVDDDSSYTSIACANTGSGDANLYLDASNGDLSGGDYCMVAQNNDLDMVLRNNESSSAIIFQTGGTTERLRIGSSGGVGLSTTLIRNGYFMNIAAPSQAYVPGTNMMDGGGICFQGTDNSFATGRTYPGIFWTGNTAALGRARAGIVGVSVANNDATNIIFLNRHMADGSTLTPTDETMRITTEGRLGIGTTSPEATRLHCWDGDSGGTTASGAVVTIEKNDTATLQFLSPNNAYNAIRWGDNNDNGAGWIQYNHSDNSMQFGNNGSEKLRILSGGGITFNGDTASANALDDYEEGSWTPVLNKSGDSGSVSSYTNQVGKYIRIGKMLWISFYLYKSTGSFGNLANQWYISGVPFALTTQASAAYQFIPCGYFTMNGSSQAQDESNSRWQSNSTNGNTTITMYGKSASTNWTSQAMEVSGVGCLELA